MSHVAIIALAAGVAGCSSDFTRFDRSLYSNAMPTQQEVAAANPYPGDVDPTTTASVGNRGPIPLATVSQRTPQGVYHQPEPTYASNAARQPLQTYQPPVQNVQSGAQPETIQSYGRQAQNTYNQTVERANLAKPVYQPNPYVNKAQEVAQKPVDLGRKATDRITTASISQDRPSEMASNAIKKADRVVSPTRSVGETVVGRAKATVKKVQDRASSLANNRAPSVAPAPMPPSVEQNPYPGNAPANTYAPVYEGQGTQPTSSGNNASTRPGGWNSAGGTAITVRQGETLYNLSKRFGVPVSALMKANKLTDANQVQAGQQIVIPTYVYSANTGVSAPDADPKTRASRATTGFIGEIPAERAGVPSRRPQDYAAIRQDGSTDDPNRQRYQPKRRATPAGGEKTVPDYSIVTGSVTSDGSYKVKAGDNLSAIARRHNTSVDAIQRANGLTSTNIRVGQWLKLPNASQPTRASTSDQQAALGPNLPPNVDPIVTGGTRSASKPKPYVKPTIDNRTTASVGSKAPERTGIAQWRWPVNGRVISRFGEKNGASRNDGIDISVPEGTAIKAVENGVVIYADNELKQFGNLVLVRHEGGYVSAYANAKNFEVSKGQQVRRGQTIARSGRTGNADQPQLHFELRKNSNPVDPLQYLSGS